MLGVTSRASCGQELGKASLPKLAGLGYLRIDDRDRSSGVNQPGYLKRLRELEANSSPFLQFETRGANGNEDAGTVFCRADGGRENFKAAFLSVNHKDWLFLAHLLHQELFLNPKTV